MRQSPFRRAWIAPLVMMIAIAVAGVCADAQMSKPPSTPPPAPPAAPPSDPPSPPKTLPERIQEAIDQTPPRGPMEPGISDPEVQKRFDEMRQAGVPMPEAKYVRDLPEDVRGMFGRTKWDDPAPHFEDIPGMPGVQSLERPPVDIDRVSSSWRPAYGWMDWWEANRERYWPQRPGEPARDSGEVPDRVFAAMEMAARSSDPAVRAQVALTLGIVKHPKALQMLSELTQDPSDGVAMHSWAAIGLLNTPEAAEFLEDLPHGQRNAIGWALAVGLSDNPTEAMWNGMPRFVDESKAPEAQRLALWAMRMHLPPSARQLFLLAFNSTSDPVFHSESLRGLAKINRAEDVANLVNLARGMTDSVPWEYVQRLDGARPRRGVNFRDVAARHERNLSRPLVPGRVTERQDPREGILDRKPKSGVGSLGRAALEVLAEIETPSDSVLDIFRSEFRHGVPVPLPDGQHVWRVLKQGERLTLPNGRLIIGGGSNPTALLALGRAATGDDVWLGKEILGGVYTKEELNQMQMPGFGRRASDPTLRGFAAVSQGLYLHKGGLVNEHSGNRSSATAKPIEAAADELFVYYQMAEEDQDIRAACALGIGLSGNPQFAVRIKQGMQALQPGDEVVWGFAIWALGMLGDPQAAELAGQYIGPARQTVDVDGLLARQARPAPMELQELIARRAAVAGLAALGDARALPYLYGEWGKNPFLDLEVARAIARCRKPVADGSPPGMGLDPFVEAMCRLVVQERRPDLAASAAMSLGALYEMGQRARLGELIAGAAPPIAAARRLQGGKMDLNNVAPEAVLSLGNPFYYLVLRQKAEDAAPMPPPGR